MLRSFASFASLLLLGAGCAREPKAPAPLLPPGGGGDAPEAASVSVPTFQPVRPVVTRIEVLGEGVDGLAQKAVYDRATSYYVIVRAHFEKFYGQRPVVFAYHTPGGVHYLETRTAVEGDAQGRAVAESAMPVAGTDVQYLSLGGDWSVRVFADHELSGESVVRLQ